MVSRPRTIALTIEGPIARADLPGLCDRVCTLMEANAADELVCDLRNVRVDAVTIDMLARLQLAARRHGSRIRLCNSPRGLLELVDFMGLTAVLPCEKWTPTAISGSSSG